MIKLAVISHALSLEIQHARWRLLAQKFPVDVTLIIPRVWKNRWLVDEFVFRPRVQDEGRFHVRPLPTTTQRYWGKYLFLSRDLGFRDITPDVIYTIQEEHLWVHQQVIACRNRWAANARMMFFSMNALSVPQRRWDQRFRWDRVKKNYDAAVCHYPGCLRSLSDAGFDKPIFMQTQVGIDEELYRPDEKQRVEMRKELGADNDFVIGYAGRLTADKGLDVLMEALTALSGSWKLLLLGNGQYRADIERIIGEKGWQDRVIFPGTVDRSKVARYLRVMDCFVIGSRTRDYWIDTFPNSLVQAMACGVAVIGSDSGAIPYIIKDTGLIIPEGDVRRTAQAIDCYRNDSARRQADAQSARDRAVSMFGCRALAENFYGILEQVMSGRYRTDLTDENQQKAWI